MLRKPDVWRWVEAGNAMEAAGFTDIRNVVRGFEGDLDEHHHRNALNYRITALRWMQSKAEESRRRGTRRCWNSGDHG